METFASCFVVTGTSIVFFCKLISIDFGFVVHVCPSVFFLLTVGWILWIWYVLCWMICLMMTTRNANNKHLSANIGSSQQNLKEIFTILLKMKKITTILRMNIQDPPRISATNRDPNTKLFRWTVPTDSVQRNKGITSTHVFFF